MTTPDLAGLCERLRTTEPVGIRRDYHKPINPDGPEAAAAIESLVAALEPFARLEVLEPNGVIVGLERLHFERARTALEGAHDDR